MADVKISQLPAATTPLDGTEVLPIVQSATTKQVSIANVTAGRAMSASSLTLTTPLAVTSGGTGLSTTGAGTFLVSATADTVSATATPSLGVASTTSGTLRLFNSASASGVTIASGNNAGAWTLTLPTSGGTNGYILTTNGSGVSSWTNPTALGIDLDVGTTAITNGTSNRVLYQDGSNVLQESANFTFDGTNVALAGTLAMGSSFLRNRIINGAMVIDQRNAGASGTANAYTVDRWAYYGSQASKGTWQQNAGSVTPPTGFSNYLGFTSSSAYSVTSTDEFLLSQNIEGFNFADFGWGTANAKTITLSFWVYSSLTGTFGGAFRNNVANRSYPFSYTISSANTWTYITKTIPGDTTGSWVGATNGNGCAFSFGLGQGSSASATAGSWAAGNYTNATGATSVVGTNGATFYITGVQLEVGSVATPFERRQYGTELMLCQRYYYKTTVSGPSLTITPIGFTTGSTQAYGANIFPVTMRVAPSALEQTGTAADYRIYTVSASSNCSSVPLFASASTTFGFSIFTVASGLTASQPCVATTGTGASSAYLGWSAEL